MTRVFSAAVVAISILTHVSASAAQDDTVELDAGLWSYKHTMSVQGQGVVHEETYEACLTEQGASLNVDQMLAEFLDGDCQQDNFTHTLGRAELYVTCRNTEDQTVSTGNLVVTYTGLAYSGNVTAAITGPGGSVNANSTTEARRVGGC